MTGVPPPVWPEVARFDSSVGPAWSTTSSALQKVCSSRGASNSMPFEPTTDGSLRPLPSFLVHCVRRRPIFASATLAAAAGLITQAYRNVDASSRPAERRLGRLSRLCCDFMTAGRCLCRDPGRCGPGKRPGALPARLGRLGWLIRSHRQHAGCQGHTLGLVSVPLWVWRRYSRL